MASEGDWSTDGDGLRAVPVPARALSGPASRPVDEPIETTGERHLYDDRPSNDPLDLPTGSGCRFRWFGRARNRGGDRHPDRHLRRTGHRGRRDHRDQGDLEGQLDQPGIAIGRAERPSRSVDEAGRSRRPDSPLLDVVADEQILGWQLEARGVRGIRRVPRLRRRCDDRGSTVVESVLIVPVAMLLLLLVIQFALWAHAAQAAHTAASEGDRVALAQGGGTVAAINQAELVLRAAGSDLQSSKIVVTLLPGDQEQVSVTGRATSILPGFQLRVSSVEVGPVQEFRSAE